ncbi:MAG: T9SS type A sorting domain-containing protein [Bacteroidetes bacterium]|nr:MAG: T9SS type A sorting domain-containing protein [Bacteroidota bacterium]
MIKRLVILLLITVFSQSEIYASRYFIKFKDKNNSPFSISNPSTYLSAKAIQRRANQGIPITDSDLPVNPAYLDSIQIMGATILNASKWLNGVTVDCDSLTYQSIQTLSFVEMGRQVMRLSAQTEKKSKKFPENIPLLSNQGMMRVSNLDYGNSFNQIHLMNGEYLHNNGFTGEGITIAVLDAGFYSVDMLSAFDSLRAKNNILGTWDFVANEQGVYEDNSHGMQVLSCMAGNVPGQLVGTSPDASFWLLRSEDVATEYIIEEYNWVSAAEFADSVGADIISSSLGYSTFDDSSTSHTYADMNGNTAPSSIGADFAASKGMLVICSAGNNGNSSWYYISAPSDGDSVLSVAAVDEFGNKAGFSSWGPSSDGDVKPNVAAKGQQTTLATSFGGVGTGNGTSFACPVLAGSAACLWQAHPLKSNMEIFNAIQQSANYYQTPGDSLGYGIPNFIVADLLLGGSSLSLPGDDHLVGLYPNPFQSEIKFQFFSAASQMLVIEIIDAIGKVVRSEKRAIQKGMMNTVQLSSLSGIQQGVYFVLIKASETSFLRKVIKY